MFVHLHIHSRFWPWAKLNALCRENCRCGIGFYIYRSLIVSNLVWEVPKTTLRFSNLLGLRTRQRFYIYGNGLLQ